MSYQIEIHGYDDDAHARKEAERLSCCNADGVATIVWLIARGPNSVVDHCSGGGWDIGSTDPDDAQGGFSLVIELDAKTEPEARSITEAFCTKAKVRGCSLLMDLETRVDQYNVIEGWLDGPDEVKVH